ncbi:MAG: iron-containing alcohol dehydrogenase [Clostridiaceae bacterium]|mgnify:CR=1 FL=1|nr:iron-containing alcohol dehydrogenase [Clostridiaceae bacterium]
MSRYFQPTRISFGAGTLNNLAEIAKPYGTKCCLVTTENADPLKPLYDRVKALLEAGGISVIHFDKVEPDPGSEMLEEGINLIKENPVDFILAVGGGSSIDSAKALAFTYGLAEVDWQSLFEVYDSPFRNPPRPSDQCLPLIAVPTTSGTGSQVTQASVVTHAGEKLTFYHEAIFAKEAILDPELLLTMPKGLTAMSGFDAFTHAFESYISMNGTDLSRMDSLNALRLIFKYLPVAYNEPDNLEARMMMSLADTMAGKALSNGGAEAPHPLSELLGSYVQVPHGQALAIVYPAFLKASMKKHQADYDTIFALMKEYSDFLTDEQDLAAAIETFLDLIGLRRDLDSIGVTDEIFEQINAHPMLDHLPFGDGEYLRGILAESRTLEK